MGYYETDCEEYGTKEPMLVNKMELHHAIVMADAFRHGGYREAIEVYNNINDYNNLITWRA
jgi:hypothetical protein